MKKAGGVAALCTLGLWGCDAGGPVTEEVGHAEEALSPESDFEVDFIGCTEFAGVGTGPYAAARAQVPASLTLTGDGSTFAILVVRVASCEDVLIDGQSVGGGTVAQVGVNIVAPEGDGDINNYTLHYDTDSAALASKLKKAGVNVRHVPSIVYELDGSTLEIEVPNPSKARYEVSATVTPGFFPVPFTANWWRDNDGRLTKMNTVLPAISFGGAASGLETQAHSALPPLVGGTTMSFPFLDSYNTFPDAHMVVDER